MDGLEQGATGHRIESRKADDTEVGDWYGPFAFSLVMIAF